MAQNISAPSLPETGFLRLRQVLQFIPVGPTRWYEGVKSGEFPAPVSLGARAKGYRVADIRALIDRLNAQAPAAM
ncbi:MAG: AlpA family phage regulatory protein [Desulfovibrio desulfuricans]|nr:AlpA family phage regulatory protein [Desulfovibrio desulfuricans]